MIKDTIKQWVILKGLKNKSIRSDKKSSCIEIILKVLSKTLKKLMLK